MCAPSSLDKFILIDLNYNVIFQFDLAIDYDISHVDISMAFLQ